VEIGKQHIIGWCFRKVILILYVQRTEVENQNVRPASADTPSENRSSPVPQHRVTHSGVLPDVLPPQVPQKAVSAAPDFAVMERGAELVPPHAQQANQPEVSFFQYYALFNFNNAFMIALTRLCICFPQSLRKADVFSFNC